MARQLNFNCDKLKYKRVVSDIPY